MKSEVMTGDNFDLNSPTSVGAHLLTNSCVNGVDVEKVNPQPRVKVGFNLYTNPHCA